MSIVAYIIIHISISILLCKSLYEVLFGETLAHSHLWVFGSLYCIHARPRVKDKFGEIISKMYLCQAFIREERLAYLRSWSREFSIFLGCGVPRKYIYICNYCKQFE